MYGNLRGMDYMASSNAAARGHFQDAGQPPHVHRTTNQCLIEEVVIYGQVGKHPYRPVSPDSFRDFQIQYDAITAWQFKVRCGFQLIQSSGHEVDFDEVPPSARVLARLRLEPYELLEENHHFFYHEGCAGYGHGHGNERSPLLRPVSRPLVFGH